MDTIVINVILETEATTPIQSGWVDKPVEGYAHIYSDDECQHTL